MKTYLHHKLTLLSVFCFLASHLFAQPLSFSPRGMGGGGAVYSPAISPHNPNEAYLGCDMGQMLHTTDFGSTWRTLHFDTLSGQRHTRVNYTNHPDTMYVLKLDPVTSKNYPSISTDHGKVWTIVPSAAFWGPFGGFRLFANPSNSRQVIASSYTNIYFSNNWGASFTSIHSAAAQGASFVHLAGVLYTNDTIFVSSDKGWIISSNNGASWSSFTYYSGIGIPAGEAVVSFAGAQSANTTRFFATTITASALSPKTEPRDIKYFQKLLRMNYVPANPLWKDITDSLRNADGVLNTYNYAYQVTMNPDNPDTLYFTGQTRSPATSNGNSLGTVFKTTDGGSTYKNVFLKNTNTTNIGHSTGWVGGCNFVPAEHAWPSINTSEGLCVDPKNINRLMRSDFSIVCTSTDGGQTWQQKYVSSGEHSPGTVIKKTDVYKTNGLQTTVCHSVYWIDSMRMLVTYSDLLLWESNDAGQTWGYLYDSLWSQKVNDISMMEKAPSGRWYAPEGETLGNNGDWSDGRLSITTGGKIMYSDNAVNWHLLKDFGSPVSWAALDPNNPSVLYVTVLSAIGGVGGIYKCTGLPNNPVWSQLNSPTRSEKRPSQVFALKNGDLVLVCGARDSSSGTPYYSFTASSGVFISSNGGNNWTDLCAAYPGMQKDVRFMILDPNDTLQNTWLVGVGSSGVGSVAGLYRTVNRGSSWTNVWQGKTVLSCTFHPSNPAHMYVCTANDGLYYAKAANSNNPVITRVEAYPFRAPERVHFNPYKENEIWIASWGNGVSVGTVPTYTIQVTQAGNGTVKPGATFTVSQFANKKISFTPQPGNHIDSVWIDNVYTGSDSVYTFTDIQANHAVRVSFAANTQYFTIQSSAASNGSISPSGAVTLAAGDTQKFSIIPAPGYHTDSLLVDGVPVTADTVYTFSNVQANHSIRAVFAINRYTITATAGTGGSIQPAGVIQVKHGDSITFSITPNAAYHTDTVWADGISSGPLSSFTFRNVVAPHVLHASFKPDPSGISSLRPRQTVIYPNPTSGIIYISGANPAAVFTLTDTQGRNIPIELHPAGAGGLLLCNVQHLPAGVYLLFESTGNSRVCFKLCMQHR